MPSTEQKVKGNLSGYRPHLEVGSSSVFPSRMAVSSTVSKAFIMVDILASKSGQGINLAEMSALLNMPKSSTHRYLATLVELGLAERDPSDRYRLGTKVLELAGSFLANSDFPNECQPFMVELAEKSEETIHLAVPSGIEVVYIAKIESRHAWGMFSHLGARFPMYCTALGKSILAFSDQVLLHQVTAQTLKSRTPKTITSPAALEAELANVKSYGFALDDEENEIGICCVGAPIFDYTGSVIAAISISGPYGRIDRERCLQLGPLVREIALKISRRRGFAGQINYSPA